MGEERTLRGDLGLPPLPERFAPGLRLVFVGFNPGERSAQLGRYYAGRNNRFWWLLHQSGLTDRQLTPEEDELLLRVYRIGLTDLVMRPSKSASDLDAWELRAGAAELRERMAAVRPPWVCLNGKGVAEALFKAKGVAYGPWPEELVPGVRVFVAASPSGRSREPIAVKLAAYRELRALVEASDRA